MVKEETADPLKEVEAGLGGTFVKHDVARSVYAAPMRQLQVTLLSSGGFAVWQRPCEACSCHFSAGSNSTLAGSQKHEAEIAN